MRWKFWRRKPNMNPGSEAAARAGCICSPHFNNVGKKKPKGGWKVMAGCFVHGDKIEDEDFTHVREVRPEGW